MIIARSPGAVARSLRPLVGRELAHLENRKHDRKFWESVSRWLYDYEARKARLRELGPSLVW